MRDESRRGHAHSSSLPAMPVRTRHPTSLARTPPIHTRHHLHSPRARPVLLRAARRRLRVHLRVRRVVVRVRVRMRVHRPVHAVSVPSRMPAVRVRAVRRDSRHRHVPPRMRVLDTTEKQLEYR